MASTPPRAATLHEVAALAGVSHQTVSRFLHNKGPFKPATIERVEAAIQELNYRPNMIARSMRTRETGILAAILPSPVTAMPTPTLAAAAELARQSGYFMEISVIEGPAQDRAKRTQELLDSGRLEGVLALGALPGMSEQPRGPGTTALAILDQYDDRLRGIGPLADASALREIIETLAGMGHRRFLHIQGPQDWSSARARREEYLRSIEDLGLDSHGIRGGDWTLESGYAAVSGLEEDSGVTAVIAANDYLALGALRAAHDRGWPVPRRLSITGWDDLPTARYAVPALSTVAVDQRSQGRSAMERLIALVRNEPAPDSTIPVSRLILRESTGPAPEPEPSEVQR
ncbi:LacI family DNA-binding transcriptional regulator [Nesterenkonia sp. E16_7]|uniref:LacI family DNA-binding transcriptional regulator n=1 Tax=unclassified Nesterenkonia TaxID=2629769 RepID=UPI001A936108|nr:MULTISPECIES: LacI family DNA-binding transcriptional regulator [unclassified Nesterenkonia]MBO0596442.1 LacI family DNA-binding transcriptional regulator [Nesterenkonia sp. E16_10]MBO0597330.1 LacI family DNA-binding transcriptional regulator [Nesterenkonia sp. E16_7]